MKKVFVIAVVLAMLLVAALPVSLVSASGPSVNVGAIGGLVCDWTYGGTLPALPGFIFTNMAPGAVNAANLANFDTVLLNVASTAMACNTNNLSAQAKTDLIAFVAGGKKLIIVDSECGVPVNYSWLPYPFITNNPGATGAFGGTLTNVQNDTLSSNNPVDASYINVGLIASQTDAVGDMNVMVTFDGNWCVDLTGTNVNNATGPVQTYARYGTGLFLYDGMDWDYCTATPGTGSGGANLCKVWQQLLLQPVNPDGLPCGVSPVGITLSPSTATNPVGTNHTVTANVSNILGVAQPSVTVTFLVTAGPNAGATGQNTTDVNGNAQWTYPDNGGAGTDTITASFTDQAGLVHTSAPVSKVWNGGGGPQPPIEVGGDIYPTNMLVILAPWLALAIVVAVGTTILIRRRQHQS